MSDATSVTLALCASTALSIALLIVATIISLLHTPLVLCLRTPNRSLLITRIVMHNFSSIFLIIPAIVNLVLAFTWKNSSFPQFRVAGRCHFDVDVVWSSPPSRCDGSRAISWKVWLAASIVRLALTTIILVSSRNVICIYILKTLVSIQTIYHITARAYHITRHPYPRRQYRTRRGSSNPHPASPEMTAVSNVLNDFAPLSSRHPSTSGDQSTVREDMSKFHSSESRLSTRPLSDASDITEADLMALRETPISAHRSSQSHSTAEEQSTLTTGSSDKIDARTSSTELTSQSDETSTSRPARSGSLAPMDLAELPIPIVGSFVRRMPTIESLSSREVHSRGSSHGHKTGCVPSTSVHSHGTHSRSPTRSPTNDTSSRSNSSPAGQAVVEGSDEGEVVHHCQSPTTSTYYTATSSMMNGSQLERTEGHEPDS
jgi:hypothetical protein